MDITLKDKNGVTLHTAKKHCKEDITVRVETQEISITPSATEQVEEGLFNKVTVQGDANLVPENIKIGTNIFGIEGGFDAVDTRDANAIAEDIAEGKTAYVNNIKLTGAMKPTTSNITKGVIVNECNENGYATEVSIVGMTEIPKAYFYNYDIGDGSKSWIQYCKKINLPSNITSIGSRAFLNCESWESQSLPEGIKTIDANAFEGCRKLALTKLPNTLERIAAYAFSNCVELPLAEIPERTTLSGVNIFYNCYKLALQKLPEHTTTISNYCFYNCKEMPLSELPSGLTSIGTYSFYTCEAMTIKEIPIGVTKIETNAFRYCSGLTEITCLGDIKSIAAASFQNCSSLTKFVLTNITGNVNLLNKSAFASTPIASGTGYIYVPDDLVDSFKTATNWSTYANQIKGVSELA